MWYNQVEDRIEMNRMTPPYEKIAIGSHPSRGMRLETAKSFDVFINLTNIGYDLLPGTVQHNVPLIDGEIYSEKLLSQIREILDRSHELNQGVYLHCEHGAHRSPYAAMNWLLSKGHTLEEAANISGGSSDLLSSLNLEQFRKQAELRLFSR